MTLTGTLSRPVSNGRSNLDARAGIGEEWGVYDALIQCVDNSDQWLEYGIIEHRYKLAHPTTYAMISDRGDQFKRLEFGSRDDAAAAGIPDTYIPERLWCDSCYESGVVVAYRINERTSGN
ncbi:MAG: hypothetical protein OXN44_06920 [Acidimicrobiaceae bacterium]|nr:hypothetical protein [Acidimicrobiaceae bacterium]